MCFIRADVCYIRLSCFFLVTDEIPFLQAIISMSVHEATVINIVGTTTHLQKRLDR